MKRTIRNTSIGLMTSYIIFKILAILITLIVFSSAAGNRTNDDNLNKWSIKTIDCFNEPFSSSSLAIDNNDKPHVFYYSKDKAEFRHAIFINQVFKTEVIERNTIVTCPASSINQNIIHLIYNSKVNKSTYKLKYAEKTKTGWFYEIIDNNLKLNSNASLLKVNEVQLGFCCTNSNGELFYVSGNKSKWCIERIGFNSGYSSLIINDEGQPLISYYDRKCKELKFMSKIGNKWVTDVVFKKDILIANNTITLTPNKQINILINDNSNDQLIVASKSEYKWVVKELVKDVYGLSSVLTDKIGNSFIVYTSYKNKNESNNSLLNILKYSLDGEIKTEKIIDTGMIGLNLSSIFDSKENIHITFILFDKDNIPGSSLIYATNRLE